MSFSCSYSYCCQFDLVVVFTVYSLWKFDLVLVLVLVNKFCLSFYTVFIEYFCAQFQLTFNSTTQQRISQT